MVGTRVALIRGINVGRAKRVAMANLCTLVEDLGYSDVRTILNSGNVIFNASDTDTTNPATRIGDALSTKLGVSARVIVLTMAEFSAVVSDNPLIEVSDDFSRLLVTVFENPSDSIRLKPLEQQDWTPEVLAIGARAAYQWCSDGILASRLVKAVGHELGDAATTRNWATVMKLQYAASQTKQ